MPEVSSARWSKGGGGEGDVRGARTRKSATRVLGGGTGDAATW